MSKVVNLRGVFRDLLPWTAQPFDEKRARLKLLLDYAQVDRSFGELAAQRYLEKKADVRHTIAVVRTSLGLGALVTILIALYLFLK